MWEPQGMYSKFILKQPTILFGENAIMGLKTYASSRIAVIHGSSLSEHYKTKVLKALSAFEVTFIEKKWQGEPTIISLSDTIEKVEKIHPVYSFDGPPLEVLCFAFYFIGKSLFVQ